MVSSFLGLNCCSVWGFRLAVWRNVSKKPPVQAWVAPRHQVIGAGPGHPVAVLTVRVSVGHAKARDGLARGTSQPPLLNSRVMPGAC